MRSSHHAGKVWPGPGGPGPRARALVFLGVLPLLAGATGAAAQGAAQPAGRGFRVIVHADNTVARLPAKTVANMFLKKSKRWDNGDLVVPVDLEPRHPVRKVFTRAVHKKSITAIGSFWQRIIFAGRGVPPESKATEEEVLAFVAANPGAIGYVSDETELGDGVRQLGVDDLKGRP